MLILHVEVGTQPLFLVDNKSKDSVDEKVSFFFYLIGYADHEKSSHRFVTGAASCYPKFLHVFLLYDPAHDELCSLNDGR